MKMASARDQLADFERKGAALLQGDSLIAVVIDADQAQSKAVLDQIIITNSGTDVVARSREATGHEGHRPRLGRRRRGMQDAPRQ
jgi:hypothetical protein